MRASLLLPPRTLLLVGLVLLALSLSAVQAQDRTREARSVASFTEIEYAIPGTLHLRQGSEPSVEVAAPADVLDKIETTVDGSALEIKSGDNAGLFDWLFGGEGLSSDQIDIYVTVVALDRLSLAGSGRVVGETAFESESLALNVAGSGDMELTVSTEALSVQVAGSGTCTVEGTARTLEGNIAGSGDLRATGLSAERAEFRIAGSGDAEVNVSDHLSAQIFGSGDVRYRGRPSVETNLVGSGEVTALE